MLLSIIVPVYNVEKYLNKCLDSLLHNKPIDVEIIIVDDGSKDNSGIIADSYTNKEGVKIIHKQNGGLSSARNAGLKLAKGDYVSFIDSDDWVLPNFYEIIKQELRSSPELLAFGYCNFNETKNQTYNIDLINKSNIVDVKNALVYLDDTGYFFNLAWNKVYRRELLHDIWFEEGTSYCEDLLFNCNVFTRIREVKLCSDKYYVYRTTEKSLTNNRFYSNYTDLADKAIAARRRVYGFFEITDQNTALVERKENEYYVGAILNIYKKNPKYYLKERIGIIKSIVPNMYPRKTGKKRIDLVLSLKKNPILLDCVLSTLFFIKIKRRYK